MKKGKIDPAKVVILTAFFCALCFSVFSQPGIKEFGDATREVKRTYHSLVYLMSAIGAVAGILGGVRVFYNWNTGKDNIDAEVIGWFFSCIFFQIIALSLTAIYGM